MTTELPIIEARKQLTKLPEAFAAQSHFTPVTVTRRGKPVLTIMPTEVYEALIETLEIAGDDNLMNQLRTSIDRVKSGQLLPWGDVKAELQS